MRAAWMYRTRVSGYHGSMHGQRLAMHAMQRRRPYHRYAYCILLYLGSMHAGTAMVPKKVLALIAIYGQLGQLYIDPEYYNQHAGNTATHACSGGTPRGGTAVLQGNAGKIEKPSKY